MRQACLLYGMIHARFIMTASGHQKMLEKYKTNDFGSCSLFNCESQAYLPLGLSDQPYETNVKLYCPRCENIYIPRSSRHIHIDGAFFGTSFPHLFFMLNPERRPSANKSVYVPRIYGFKLHPRATQIQYEQSSKKCADSRKLKE
uniref:Casein kinase II subunit beta n=1 Tax=Myxobolus squamalis TaxID=59785 RepID=A0A6B2GAA5_MYXSQ